MFQNFFLTAWRNLKRNRVFSAINILGLSLGMTVALTIGLWVYHEYSFDKFLPGYDQIYQVRRNFDSNGEILNFTTTSLKLADALKQVPEIERVIVSDWMGTHGLMVGDRKLNFRGAVADGEFLEAFRYPMVKGSPGVSLKDAYSIVISESMAKAFFGSEDPINKTIRYENRHDLKVTGVLKDVPANSTFQFSFIIPLAYMEQTYDYMKGARQSFGNNSWQQFVQLKPGSNPALVAEKVRLITRSEQGYNAQHSEVVLQPMERWHLYSKYVNGKDSGGFIEYIRIFCIIGVAVLLIGCINFVNLSTARSEKRAREVGVRKAIGSLRGELVIQFMLESFLMTFIAFLLACVLLELALPLFNQLAGKSVAVPYREPLYWIALLGLVLITALAAGAKPALYLSAFRPVQVLKGKVQHGTSSSLSRKILVVTQFTCSIALIVSTIVIYNQVQFAKNRPTGFDTNRLMVTWSNGDIPKNYTALRNELLQSKIITDITTASSPATEIYWHSGVDNWPGMYPNENIEMATVVIGQDYFRTMGIKFREGHDFTSLDDTTKVIFNQAAMTQMRIKDPIGKLITWNEKRYEISGVIEDALIASPFAAAEPMMFLTEPGTQGCLIYRLADKVPAATAISKLTAIFNRYNPSFSYDYSFADHDYAQKFNLEQMIGKLSGIFALLAICISCLGLFGLAAYMAEQRNKEIGIRKVLGASVGQVWMLLSKDFAILVFISILISTPVAWYFLQHWLSGYDYRVTIGAEVFIIAGILALLITLATVSFQSVRAALANPVSSLKDE
ncbi:ABC transporter permease [Flavihumibacter petaseus]|uniref:Putative ABC transporter permease protein n=1 Tax=Flavihumibacter petaseus NBRC 106054 TaxID=1220578 RepID=A0A0E9MVM1_9BACT|nr:ABC transporter permease [Flavihumibacter petaseus]GAO41533.1 putative ABC transporter permease protein [Flavihumibacter petaseus NBRC 106054]